MIQCASNNLHLTRAKMHICSQICRRAEGLRVTKYYQALKQPQMCAFCVSMMEKNRRSTGCGCCLVSQEWGTQLTLAQPDPLNPPLASVSSWLTGVVTNQTFPIFINSNRSSFKEEEPVRMSLRNVTHLSLPDVWEERRLGYHFSEVAI